MTHKIRILYTIPNFDTAESGIPLLKIPTSLDANYFEPHIACCHDRGDLFQEVKNSGLEVHIIDLYKNARPIISMMIEFILILFPFKIRKYFSLFTPIRKFINRYINAKNNLIK